LWPLEQVFHPPRLEPAIASSMQGTRWHRRPARAPRSPGRTRPDSRAPARPRGLPAGVATRMNSSLPQAQRHLRGARLVRAVAVENDVAIARNLAVASLQLVRRHLQGAAHLRVRRRLRRSITVTRSPASSCEWSSSGVIRATRRSRTNCRRRSDFQPSQPANASSTREDQPGTQRCGRSGGPRDGLAEHVTERGERSRPQQRPQSVPGREPGNGHAQHAGEGGRHDPQARHELPR